MTEKISIQPDYETKDETKAGNYFVSNYPPFSFWNEQDVPCVSSLLNSPSSGSAPLGIYYHVPFCRKRCHFCYFKVYTDKNSNDVRKYLASTIKELQSYTESNYVKGRKPKFVYFGGGTPSYLSAQQLEDLTDQMKAVLPWDDAEEVTFECEPGTLSEKKLEAIKKFGVTRLSLGVENFSDHILEINGRAHRSKEVFSAYKFAKELGFENINIDLIAGMLDETDENWTECVEQVKELSPDCVTIYQMEVPFNTGIFKSMKEGGKLTAPVADWPTKRRWVNQAYEALEKVGYTVTSAYTAVKNPETTKFIYRDRLWSGADMIGLGVSSFGHLGGIHYQNLTNIDHYCDTIEAKKTPIRRALLTNDEERFIRELILQWKLGRVNQKYFNDKFGVNISERYYTVLSEWKGRGDLSEENEELVLSRSALLKVDTLLHSLFLPRHRNAERYV